MKDDRLFIPMVPTARAVIKSISLPGDVWEAIDAIAEEKGAAQSRSRIMYYLLTWAIKHYREDEPNGSNKR